VAAGGASAAAARDAGGRIAPSRLHPRQTRNTWPAFAKGLAEAGFVESRNIAIEYRWGHGEGDRLPELAADLASRRVSVIVTPGGVAAALAAKTATTTLPIVFVIGIDRCC
jgi:putative ABC transport system substrate-binding protein